MIAVGEGWRSSPAIAAARGGAGAYGSVGGGDDDCNRRAGIADDDTEELRLCDERAHIPTPRGAIDKSLSGERATTAPADQQIVADHDRRCTEGEEGDPDRHKLDQRLRGATHEPSRPAHSISVPAEAEKVRTICVAPPEPAWVRVKMSRTTIVARV